MPTPRAAAVPERLGRAGAPGQPGRGAGRGAGNRLSRLRAEEQCCLYRVQGGHARRGGKRLSGSAAASAQCADRADEELGYGNEYRYAHDEPDAYAAGEDYFPETMEPRRYYHLCLAAESKIRDKLEHLARLDRESPIQRRKE